MTQSARQSEEKQKSNRLCWECHTIFCLMSRSTCMTCSYPKWKQCQICRKQKIASNQITLKRKFKHNHSSHLVLMLLPTLAGKSSWFLLSTVETLPSYFRFVRAHSSFRILPLFDTCLRNELVWSLRQTANYREFFHVDWYHLALHLCVERSQTCSQTHNVSE